MFTIIDIYHLRYSDFSHEKDIQIAIFSSLLLQSGLKSSQPMPMTQQSQPHQVMPKLAGADYFSLIKEHTTRPSPPSAWPRQHRSSRVAPPLAHSLIRCLFTNTLDKYIEVLERKYFAGVARETFSQTKANTPNPDRRSWKCVWECRKKDQDACLRLPFSS